MVGLGEAGSCVPGGGRSGASAPARVPSPPSPPPVRVAGSTLAVQHSDPTWVSIKDVHELVDLLLAPSHRRTRGVHLAQPTLVRAGPGTGKTWMVKQAAYMLAKRLGADSCDQCVGHTSLERPKPCEHGGMMLVPLVVYVQRIVRLVREQGDESEIINRLLTTRTMLLWCTHATRHRYPPSRRRPHVHVLCLHFAPPPPYASAQPVLRSPRE